MISVKHLNSLSSQDLKSMMEEIEGTITLLVQLDAECINVDDDRKTVREISKILDARKKAKKNLRTNDFDTVKKEKEGSTIKKEKRLVFAPVAVKEEDFSDLPPLI